MLDVCAFASVKDGGQMGCTARHDINLQPLIAHAFEADNDLGHQNMTARCS
jgi:hypothetical protein